MKVCRCLVLAITIVIDAFVCILVGTFTCSVYRWFVASRELILSLRARTSTAPIRLRKLTNQSLQTPTINNILLTHEDLVQ